MAIYNVTMGQAVYTEELTAGNILATGLDGNYLNSCSAVVMVRNNGGRMAAGIYHYPAGMINKDPQSQTVLLLMEMTINPTIIYVGNGIHYKKQQSDYMKAYFKGGEQEYEQELMTFLRGFDAQIEYGITNGRTFIDSNGNIDYQPDIPDDYVALNDFKKSTHRTIEGLDLEIMWDENGA